MSDGVVSSGELAREVKLLLGIAGVGAVLLLFTGVSLLTTGGRIGLLLGGTTVAVAAGQVVTFAALYRGVTLAWSAALALLVTGAMLQAATGDWFGALVELLIAAALYLNRDAL